MHGEFSFSRLTYVTAAHCIVHDMTRQKCIPPSHGFPPPTFTFKQRSQTTHLEQDQFGIGFLLRSVDSQKKVSMDTDFN